MKGNKREEIKMESMGDFASVVYKFAKFDGPYAVENPQTITTSVFANQSSMVSLNCGQA